MRKRTAHVFKNSLARTDHPTYLSTLPGMRLDQCSAAFTLIPDEKETPETLADVRKAHVQYWNLVAEECRNMQFGFTL